LSIQFKKDSISVVVDKFRYQMKKAIKQPPVEQMSYFPNGLKIRLPMFLPGAIMAAEMANNDLF